MPEQQTVPPARGGKRGALIIVVLAVIFVALLAAVVKFASRDKADSAPPPPEELVVIPDRLRVRTQPSAKAAVVVVAQRGQTLELVEDAGAWVRVKTADGIVGWAERSALEAGAEHERRIERTAAIRKMPALDGVVTREVTLFAGPGIFYPPVGEMQAGARVQVYTRDHDFFAIEGGDGIAYADVDAIDVSAAGGAELEVASRPAVPGETPLPEITPLPTVPPIAEFTPEPEPTRPPVSTSRVYRVVPSGGSPPVLVEQVQPRYPATARRAGVEGRVILRAVIRRNGSVDDVEVIRDLPHGLGEAAREAVEQWRFRPARYEGQPIDVYYTVTVNFRLSDR
jgi:TonB family protein